MAYKKKYHHFNLVGEFDSWDIDNYTDACHEYGKEETATLYGVTLEGEMSVIFAK